MKGFNLHSHSLCKVLVIGYRPSLVQRLTCACYHMLSQLKHRTMKSFLSLFSNWFLRKKTKKTILWQLEGPFDSSYSLAIVNRGLAEALARLQQIQIGLVSAEGGGEFEPSRGFLEENKEIKNLWLTGNNFKKRKVTVLSRNMFPPRVSGMNAELNMIHNYGWEETRFPSDWVQNFNKNLDLITVTSPFVKNALIDSGVKVPIGVVGNGLDMSYESSREKTHRNNVFTFLHVSSCFPRKSAEEVVEAFCEAFSDKDNVRLIIKTFKNPHNTISSFLQDVKKSILNPPSIELIEEELSISQMRDLMSVSDAVVYPSKGEGFGLPIAEAMLARKMVITTNWSGQTYFCTDDNAWLVPVKICKSQTHFDLPNSLWGEPIKASLVNILKKVVEEKDSRATKKKLNNAYQCVANNFSWLNVARKNLKYVEAIFDGLHKPKCKIGWMSTWGTKCGIASYSEHLLNKFSSSSDVTIFCPFSSNENHGFNVVPSWEISETEDFKYLEGIIKKEHKISTLVVQFNYGFADLRKFGNFIHRLSLHGVSIVLVLHATKSPSHRPDKNLNNLRKAINCSDRVIVHTLDDVNRLYEHGFQQNVCFLPLGVKLSNSLDGLKTADEVDYITTYGFLLPHKGILQFLEAFYEYKKSIKKKDLKLKLLNALYPIPESESLAEEVRKKIEQFNLTESVELITEYLPDEQVQNILSRSKLVVFPYRPSTESASASVRMALGANALCITTPIDIFEDTKEVTYQFSGLDAYSMKEGLECAINSIDSKDDLYKIKKENLNSWRKLNSMETVANNLEAMIYSLEQDKILSEKADHLK